jgi:hypothetical protein
VLFRSGKGLNTVGHGLSDVLPRATPWGVTEGAIRLTIHPFDIVVSRVTGDTFNLQLKTIQQTRVSSRERCGLGVSVGLDSLKAQKLTDGRH